MSNRRDLSESRLKEEDSRRIEKTSVRKVHHQAATVKKWKRCQNDTLLSSPGTTRGERRQSSRNSSNSPNESSERYSSRSSRTRPTLNSQAYEENLRRAIEESAKLRNKLSRARETETMLA